MKKLNSVYLDEMVLFLRSHPVLSHLNLFGTGDYESSDANLIENRPAQNAQMLQCWENVDRAVANGQGSAVYGWAFWPEDYKDDANFYIAQHHAVLNEYASGQLVDITPQGATYDGKILFMADKRVPFSITELKQPPMLFMKLNSPPWTLGAAWCQRRFVWVDHNHAPIDTHLILVNGVAFDNFDIVQMG